MMYIRYINLLCLKRFKHYRSIIVDIREALNKVNTVPLKLKICFFCSHIELLKRQKQQKLQILPLLWLSPFTNSGIFISAIGSNNNCANLDLKNWNIFSRIAWRSKCPTLPNGGSAKGIPSHALTPSFRWTPFTAPDLVCTSSDVSNVGKISLER